MRTAEAAQGLPRLSGARSSHAGTLLQDGQGQSSGASHKEKRSCRFPADTPNCPAARAPQHERGQPGWAPERFCPLRPCGALRWTLCEENPGEQQATKEEQQNNPLFGGKVLKNFCTGSLLQLALGGNANGSEAAAPRRAARREEAEEKGLQLKAEAGGEM